MNQARRIERGQIGPTTLIRLSVAAEIAFPGERISVAVLRREREKKNLATVMIGNREFTTLANIDRMIERKWHGLQEEPTYTAASEKVGRSRYGLSSTDQSKLSSVKAKVIADELRENLANILRPSTAQSATVTPRQS